MTSITLEFAVQPSSINAHMSRRKGRQQKCWNEGRYLHHRLQGIGEVVIPVVGYRRELPSYALTLVRLEVVSAKVPRYPFLRASLWPGSSMLSSRPDHLDVLF